MLSQVFLPRANATLAYLRVRYGLEEQLKKRLLTIPKHKKLIENADVIVYGRGLWDLVMADIPRRKVVLKDFESDVNFLARSVFPRPNQKIVIKLPHAVHYQHKDDLSLFNLRKCANWKRQMEERDAVICGLSRAMFATKRTENNEQLENAPHISERILILDDFGSTRLVPVLNGTDHHGHHYEGTIAESLVQHFLNLICSVTTNFEESSSINNRNKKIYRKFMDSSFQAFAKISCDRVANSHDEPPIEKCSCGTPKNVVSEEGKAYCEELKKRNIEAPFIVNE